MGDDLAKLGDSLLRSGPVEVFGARLEAHGRQVPAGRDPDPDAGIIAAVAVFPPTVGRDRQRQTIDDGWRRLADLDSDGPDLLEGVDDTGADGPPTGQVQGVDARRQLPQ
jgi:hypothetical protein